MQYSLNTEIREKIYRIIFIISILLSSAILLLFNFLLRDAIITNFWVMFFNLFIVPSVGFFYSLFKWIFNNYIWKTKFMVKFTKIPNFSGNWVIKGESKFANGTKFSGTLYIIQTFDKITIKGVFARSESYNTQTFLEVRDSDIKLSYYYQNVPKQKESDKLHIHHGFMTLTFSNGNFSGEYFNDAFRGTSGSWILEKEDAA